MILLVEKHPTARLYKFVCRKCPEHGAWHPSINDAEASGRRHDRARHSEQVQA